MRIGFQLNNHYYKLVQMLETSHKYWVIWYIELATVRCKTSKTSTPNLSILNNLICLKADELKLTLDRVGSK